MHRRNFHHEGVKAAQAGAARPGGSDPQAGQPGQAESERHAWQHGKQQNDTEDRQLDDWGKSDKH
jgi:hypothetical protein